MDAALRLISRGGPRALSVEGVAREAGVSKTVVYSAFGSLDRLAVALIDREEKRALGSLTAATPTIRSNADPGEALLEWATAMASVVTKDPVVWRLMLIPPAGMPEIVLARIQRGRELAIGQVTAVLESLVDSDAEWDLDLAARSITAAAEAQAQLMLTSPKDYPPERIARFVAALLKAIQPLAAPAQSSVDRRRAIRG